MEKAQVLILVDDTMTAMDIESQLKNLGYGVSAKASYGKEAIQKAKENVPDLVLVDIILKGEMDGIETAEEIRTQFDIPVIFLTSYADKNRLKRAKLVNPYGYILKPFQDKDLEVTIEMALYVAEVGAERKRAKEKILTANERLEYLLSSTSAVIYTAKTSGDYGGTFVSDNVIQMVGYEPKEFIENASFWFDHVHPEDKPRVQEEMSHVFERKLSEYEYRFLHKDGRYVWVQDEMKLVRDKDGNPIEIIGFWTDITDRKLAEEALKQAHDELERRIEERTRELELKTKSLEELNTAMKVLLKKREEDKTEVEQNVMTNVRELIAPYFDKINETKLDDHQKAFMNILESNLNEIVSPFTRRLSLKYLNLTPKEIQIVNMIKIGYQSKKIAKIMKISPRTVDTHRKNIRSKIGLGQKRANLRSHILAHEQ